MNRFLAQISLNITRGSQGLVEILSEVLKKNKILSISSVYKRKEIFQAELEAQFILVICCEQEGPWQEAQKNLKIASRRGQVTLLVFEKEVIMTPEMTLPSPDLHSDPIAILAAAEVWPGYVHPIYKKPLSSLVGHGQRTDRGEFLFQGQNLLEEARKLSGP